MFTKDIKKNLKYIVTKGNDTFNIGDRIWKDEDGCIVCEQAFGWIDKEDVPDAIVGVEVELDREFYLRKIETLKEEIKEIEEVLGE